MRQMKVVFAVLLLASLLFAAPVNAYQAATFQSDEFNPCGPQSFWTPVIGVSGQAISYNRTQLRLSVPAGPNQTIWEDNLGNLVYNVARVVQPFGGTGVEDFGAEVKFDSNVTEQYQQQGIVLESGAGEFLRFEFFYDNDEHTVIFGGRVYTGTGGDIIRQPIARVSGDYRSASSLSMRVSRQAGRMEGVWQLEYKVDDGPWTLAPMATQPPAGFVVTGVGVYAGTSYPNNNGTQAPAHTAVVDYFFNTASPIVNGDSASNSLTVNIVGQGSVSASPEQPVDGYDCGQSVQLTATPTSGWIFARWEGALASMQNPLTITMDGSDKTLTAVFQEGTQPLEQYVIQLPVLVNHNQ